MSRSGLLRRACVLATALLTPLAAHANPAERARSAGREEGSATVVREDFGVAPSGEPVDRYTLTNTQGVRMRVLTYGGVIQTLEVPDRDGNLANVVLGFDSLEGYTADSDPYFGALIGRYANRIAGAQFTLDGTTYQLPANNDGNTLHGGAVGFDDRVWEAEEIERAGNVGLRLRLLSEDGDQGFPGNLQVTVTYVLTNSNAVRIRYRATTDAPTVVNLTQHSYFNLRGEGSGTIYGHRLHIDADRYTVVDRRLIPRGEHADVAGTAFDFRERKPVGRDIRTGDPQILFARGYDHNFVLNGTGMRRVARVWEPRTGRVLTVRTVEPGMQLYSGNFLNGSLVGTGGRVYRQGDGLALETQHFPDSPNQPAFPSTVLRPGEVYRTQTVWRFSTR